MSGTHTHTASVVSAGDTVHQNDQWEDNGRSETTSKWRFPFIESVD